MMAEGGCCCEPARTRARARARKVDRPWRERGEQLQESLKSWERVAGSEVGGDKKRGVSSAVGSSD